MSTMTPARAERRFPASVYRHGSEPDPRFSLANERTFLAWIRTSLALLAGGVALEALHVGLQPQLRLAASILLILAGIVVPLQAWAGWARTERALRLGRVLPSAVLSLPLVAVVAAVGVVLVLAVMLA
jgi:putative membrane protein